MKKQHIIRMVRWLLILVLFAGWFTLLPRVLSGLLMAAAILLGLVQFGFPVLRRWATGFFVAALVTVLLPIDITFHNAPGPPHFVPYATGLPSREGRERHQRGEIYLSGSCFVFGNEPSYVLVW
ncbi:MAG TPA: hypothetical protein VGO11_17665 [Chthoniobacteraceae bacterium]|jgi:hypothetical protein|nr:hypothetical protein [Chthoniobacteraceae bacterium]